MNLEEFAETLKLKRAKIRGDEIHASCPFTERHVSGQDKHPSFSINVAKGVYNCFSCGARGTIEDLVSRIKETSISNALELLQLWGFGKLDRELREKDEYERPEFIPEGLLAYFDKVEDAFAEIYHGEVDDIDCLIYPVRNKQGKLVGAMARSTEGRFHKVLWNMAKKSYLFGENEIELEEPLIICEGPGDVVSLRKSGLNNSVALMGISCSDEQVERLLSLSSQFIVWLDKDLSGAKGMNTLLKKMDNRARMRYVDPWKVPEIKKKGDAKQVYEDFGPEKVVEIVNGAKTFLEHIMEDNCGN